MEERSNAVLPQRDLIDEVVPGVLPAISGGAATANNHLSGNDELGNRDALRRILLLLLIQYAVATTHG